MSLAATTSERAPELRRGVLASYDGMTPVAGRRSDDLTKFRLTIRDVVLLIAGSLAMYGAQIGVQYGMRSDIRDLKTSFDSYVQQQNSTNSGLQLQINEWRGETKLNRENVDNARQEISELKGILLGSGVKGVPK